MMMTGFDAARCSHGIFPFHEIEPPDKSRRLPSEDMEDGVHLNEWLDHTAAARAEDRIMVRQRLLSDFRLANGSGPEQPFHEFLADFNILLIRRVPEPSHGPATELLRSLLAENRSADDATVRGFDIRSPDHLCETCHGPHIVFRGRDLVTICDSGGLIYRLFGVVGDERFFVIGADRHVIDAGSIREIDRLSSQLGRDKASSPHDIARAPPEPKHPGRRDAAAGVTLPSPSRRQLG
jgi:hypothetical protein